ncbi:glycosyltransferase [Tahibacter amnicola]|uniref:Glycosyl transferase n=1 Tax=Tahibacter amnicola TaxID=2976241 RepID=A0ABY6BAM6_9GAMM|nr:glycosyltransferase [Tahibacter amnicola]UXI67118.1 glycosyl transferase [Tahibacter amnicola]
MRSRMVDLVAPPFCGHLHPLLGIGRRLAEVFPVRVVSTAAAMPQVRQAGLEGIALLDGADDAIAAIVNPPHAVRSNPWRLHGQLRQNLALLGRFRRELEACYEQCSPGLVIADFALPVAGFVAQRRGIPWWTSLPSPCVVETPDGPPAYLGGWVPRDDRLGRLRDGAGRRLVRGFKRLMGRMYRSSLRELGIDSLYRQDGSEIVYSPQRILALGSEVIEFPRRWPESLSLVGPVLYTPPTAGPAPPFRADRRHVLVTIGTHLLWLKEAMAAAVAEAARRLPHIEFHFSDGSAGSCSVVSEGNFHRIGYVDYARHLARYDLVVHHGGAGVMYHCLRHGKPALVHPVDYDQFDHAARLVWAGVARRLHRMDALAECVATALDDETLRRRCSALGQSLAATSAEETVAAWVHDLLGVPCTADLPLTAPA